MSFSENLKKLRKENGLSQEELAEIMDVSRQAVSKWESGESYPEVEKLLSVSQKFNISLDSLMSTEFENKASVGAENVKGEIVISSPKEHIVATFRKVMCSSEFKGGKKAPKYALFGVCGGGSSFFGETTTFLGWYADEDSLNKEMSEIQASFMSGEPSYELKYNVKTTRKRWGLSVTIE